MEKWLEQQLENQIKQAAAYEDRALMEATKRLIEEQQRRITQLEGEIDGRLWNHKAW
ncbi:MAG: hypothetical protein ACK5NA_01645 [Enterococcus sp.]